MSKDHFLDKFIRLEVIQYFIYYNKKQQLSNGRLVDEESGIQILDGFSYSCNQTEIIQLIKLKISQVSHSFSPFCNTNQYRNHVTLLTLV